jgi:MinD-like ATPase involved in chromosome partitioning or flagellar assembly
VAVDYSGMAFFFNKSERTLRRWENEKPEIFNMMMEQYAAQEAKESNNNSIVIATVSLKGGVGKSTISDAFGFYMDDSIILNLDLAQPASQVNACPTIDYVDHIENKSVEEIIQELSQKYRYVIIDTPGDPTAEVFEALKYASKLIIPMTVGKRTRQATESTLHTFFGEGTALTGAYDVFFLFNAYTDKKKRDEAAALFKEAYEEFKPYAAVKLNPKLGALDASNAISTAEESGKSIFQMVQENRTAYATAAKKMTVLCNQIEEHFKLN